MNKYLCFRFDIDTHICLKKGVPELLKVFDKHNVNATFFISMGKAFKRSYTISEKLNNNSTNVTEVRGRFSMLYKLGVYNSIVAFIINPVIGGKYKTVLKNAVKKGHELGLHGGRNHSTWERDAHNWTNLKLEKEILFGLNEFNKQNLPNPVSFASPCWNAPSSLNSILQKKGFKMVANHGSNLNNLKGNEDIIEFPTNVTGENKDIGFIENLRALGFSTDEILKKFSNQLDNELPFKMVFDHPFYSGVHELETIESMILIAKQKGYIIDSLKNLSHHFNYESTTHLS